MKHIIAVIIGLLAVSTALAQNQDRPRSEIEVRGNYLIPSGETSFSGTTISFSRDFALPNRFGFDIHYAYRSEDGKHKFGLMYARSSFSSTRTLSRTIDFLNHTYTANLEIESKRKMQDFSATYAYRWGNEKVRIGPMVALGFVKTSVSIEATANRGASFAEGSITKFAGLIGYDVDYDPRREINIFHNLGWIAYKHDRLFRTEAGVRYYPSRRFGVSGGYKFVNYKFVNDPNFIRAREHGPYIGGIVRF